MQEPSITPQDALPDSGTSALLAPSFVPIPDEAPRIQVRYFITFRNLEKDHLIDIPFLLTRRKIVQTTVCFLFNLGP